MKNFTYSVNQSATPKQQEKEAQKYAMDMEDKLKYGHDFDAEKMAFEEYAEKWLESVKEELAYSTYENYAMLLRNNIIPYFKGYKIINIKTPLIEAFYKILVKHYVHGTIKKHAHVLSGMFRTAIRWNMIEINPCHNARIPKQTQEEPQLKYFTPQQSLVFLKSLDIVYETPYKGHMRIDDTGKPYYVNNYTESHAVDIQYKVFYTLLLFCGFRKGETLALHWNDIDFDKKEISITKSVGKTETGVEYKKPKTTTSIRKVSFPEQIVPLLKQYHKEYNLMRFRIGSAWEGDGNMVLVYKCRQKKLNNPYYQVKDQRRCSTWRKTKNLTLRNSSSRSWTCTMPEEPRIHNRSVNKA